MNTTSLRVTVPACSFRRPYAREFLETERFPPPATVYGFLLALIGEEDRLRHVGVRISMAVTKQPEVSIVLRTCWRIKDKKKQPGQGSNRRPDYQELLTDLELGVWVAESELSEQLNKLSSPNTITRYGALSLGESRDLVNDVNLNTNWSGRRGVWLNRNCEGHIPLPVWVDHVGSKGTNWAQFLLMEDELATPPPGDSRWITIQP